MFALPALLFQLAGAAEKAIKAGMAAYKAGTTSPEALAVVVLKNTNDWKPEVKGKQILTPGLRSSLAKALAGLAHNIAAAEAGKELA